MLAVNLGTRGARPRRATWWSTATRRPARRYADRRAANGHAEPYGVRVWCLGNEMDGPWQIGHTTAERVRPAGRSTQAGPCARVDPSIELVACGSSGSSMPTFGTWEETVLDLCWDVADLVSLHAYYDPAAYGSVDDFLACSLDLERMIERVAAIGDAVAERKGSDRRIGLSVDEWNVWHLAEHQAREEARDRQRAFRRAPALAEDEQDLADALAVGCLLITLLRHADRVRIACLAQLVNVIPRRSGRSTAGPPGGRRRSTCSRTSRGSAAGRPCASISTDPTTGSRRGSGVPAIDAVAVHDAAAGPLTIFAVNRLDRPLGARRRAPRPRRPGASSSIASWRDPDIRASNTATHPTGSCPPDRPGAVSGARAGSRRRSRPARGT